MHRKHNNSSLINTLLILLDQRMNTATKPVAASLGENSAWDESCFLPVAAISARRGEETLCKFTLIATYENRRHLNVTSSHSPPLLLHELAHAKKNKPANGFSYTFGPDLPANPFKDHCGPPSARAFLGVQTESTVHNFTYGWSAHFDILLCSTMTEQTFTEKKIQKPCPFSVRICVSIGGLN